MKIGVFDSGMGGLSVLHKALEILPDADYIFYADEAHVPYGEKSPEEIRGFVGEIFHFFMEQSVDAIIIACNTATTIADQAFRDRYPIPIVGMEPAVKMAVDLYGKEGKKILVAATPVTIQGDKLKKLLVKVDTMHEADLVALPGLVRLAERGVFEGTEVEQYLKNELASHQLDSCGTVVLGCTHFNYFKNSFQRVLPGKVHFVDGNEGTIHQLMRKTGKTKAESGNSSKGTVTYYFSGALADDRQQEKVVSCMKQLDRVES